MGKYIIDVYHLMHRELIKLEREYKVGGIDDTLIETAAATVSNYKTLMSTVNLRTCKKSERLHIWQDKMQAAKKLKQCGWYKHVVTTEQESFRMAVRATVSVNTRWYLDDKMIDNIHCHPWRSTEAFDLLSSGNDFIMYLTGGYFDVKEGKFIENR